jgi:hypothetical protein
LVEYTLLTGNEFKPKVSRGDKSIMIACPKSHKIMPKSTIKIGLGLLLSIPQHLVGVVLYFSLRLTDSQSWGKISIIHKNTTSDEVDVTMHNPTDKTLFVRKGLYSMRVYWDS